VPKPAAGGISYGLRAAALLSREAGRNLRVVPYAKGIGGGGDNFLQVAMPKRTLISIVEDDQPFRESMKKLMSLLGYTVEAFPSPASFLASPLLAETACLVADVQMPGMTGVELHRHLVDAGHPIPTILVTAYADEAIRNRALNDGVVCYLYKPVDDERLERCIHSALQSGRPREEDS
jgi:FixJ family two-component response regulator